MIVSWRKEAELYLSNKSIGVFIIRKSESRKNYYVVSLKVPKYINQSEISHFLIEKTKNFYKIIGTDKQFTNLTKLITHCSLVRDLLPITLNLRYYQQQQRDINSSETACQSSIISSSSSSFSINSLDTYCSFSSSDW